MNDASSIRRSIIRSIENFYKEGGNGSTEGFKDNPGRDIFKKERSGS